MVERLIACLSRGVPACVILGLLTMLGPAHAADFELNGQAPDDEASAFFVAESGTVWAVLTASGFAVDNSFELELTPFRNAAGQTSRVYFVSDEDSGPEKIIVKAAGRAVIALDASGLAVGDTYEGELLVSESGGAAQVFSIKLTTSRTVYQTIGTRAENVAIAVPPDGIASFYFDAGGEGDSTAEVTLSLSKFVDATRGIFTDIYFADSDTADATSLVTPLEEGRMLIRLDASRVDFSSPFTGELTIAIGDTKLPAVQLSLTRSAVAMEAQLEVGQPVPKSRECRLWTCKPDPIQVDLRETSGIAPLLGLGLATVGGDKNVGGINPIDDLAIDVVLAGDANKRCEDHTGTDTTSNDLWRRDTTTTGGTVDLAAGDSATLCIRFLRKLSPGDYSIPIKITALNVEAADTHTITVSMTVTRSPVWPFAILLLSVLLSYGLTKMIRTRLQRTKLDQRITTIRNQTWYRRQWHILPMVRVKAMLRQVTKAMEFERLGKPFFFPSSLIEYVDDVDRRLPYLERLAALLSHWERSNEDQLLVNRANKELGAVIYALNNTPLEEDLDAKVVTHLATLEEWLDDTKLRGHYWNSLYGNILTIRRRINWYAYDSVSFESFIAELGVYPDENGVKLLLDQAKAGVEAIASSGAQLAPDAKKVLDEAAQAVQRLAEESVASLAGAYADVSGRLALIDSDGPEPAIAAVESLRVTIGSSDLQSDIDALAALRQAIDGGTIADPGPGGKLKECLMSFERYQKSNLATFIDNVSPVLEKQKTSDRETLRKLDASLRPDEAPENISKALERERAYCKVKLIVQAPLATRKELLEAERRQSTLGAMFETMDNAAWKLVSKGISVDAVPGQPNAFELIEFQVNVDDEEAAGTFLFKHGLKYRWQVWFENPDKSDTQPDLDVTTDEPRVFQFIPKETHNPVVKVSVSNKRNDKPLRAELRKDLRVSTAKIFGFVRAFERVELAALSIALVAALATGMQSEHYQAAVDGSASALFFLFGWGVAADQTKNLLENIKTIMGEES